MNINLELYGKIIEAYVTGVDIDRMDILRIKVKEFRMLLHDLKWLTNDNSKSYSRVFKTAIESDLKARLNQIEELIEAL